MNGSWRRGVGGAALVVLLGACAAPTCGGKPGASTITPSSAAATSGAPPTASPSPRAPLAIAAATFHPGEVGAVYVAVPESATGGTPPYSWSVASGALPDGLSLGSDGSVSGSPTSSGHFTFSVQVADSAGGVATTPGAIDVAAALSASLLPACARACQVEAGCADVCGAFGALSGGTPPFTYAVNGYVPPGVHLGNGLSYAGTFSRPVSYWQSTVTVTDSFGETASVSPTINVFAHISFSGGNCPNPPPSFGGTGCTVTLPYTGGAGKVTGKVVAISQYCAANGCYPTPSAPPPGLAISGSGGKVTVNVPGQGVNYQYVAVLTIVLTDSSPCGQGVSCSSGGGQVNVVVFAG